MFVRLIKITSIDYASDRKNIIGFQRSSICFYYNIFGEKCLVVVRILTNSKAFVYKA